MDNLLGVLVIYWAIDGWAGGNCAGMNHCVGQRGVRDIREQGEMKREIGMAGPYIRVVPDRLTPPAPGRPGGRWGFRAFLGPSPLANALHRGGALLQHLSECHAKSNLRIVHNDGTGCALRQTHHHPGEDDPPA